MKKLSVFFAAIILSGCAVESTGLRPDQLIRPQHLRTERTLALTFPEIQMALFKHETACGPGPIFRMKEDQASYATISESDSAEQPWNEAIIFDLMWLQPTWRYDTRTRVSVYSFYSSSDVKQRIDDMFNAILKPGQCDIGDETEDD